MRNRDAWLAAIAATLGIGEEACRRDATPQVQRVATAPALSSDTPVVEAPPSATASETPSLTASVAKTVTPPAATTMTPQELSQAICGAVPQQQQLRIPPGNGSAIVAVSLTGGASGDEHVATNMRPRFRACANHALAQDPSQQGKLVMTVTIAASGDVTKADIATNQGLSPTSAQCMLQGVRNVQFPAGAARTVTIAIVQTKQSP